MEKWEAVFFTSNDEKLEFENMFAKKICDSDNELYMSWLPLKLGDIGGKKELACNIKFTTSRYCCKSTMQVYKYFQQSKISFCSSGDNKQKQITIEEESPVLSLLKVMKNQQ